MSQLAGAPQGRGWAVIERLDICDPVASAIAVGKTSRCKREEPAMPIIDRIAQFHDDLTSWRRDIHAHPELGFEEQRTSDLVAAKLNEFGCEVHREIGKTGVVGRLRVGNSPRSVGLRADMDALPIQEANTFEHRSRNDGRMHA